MDESELLKWIQDNSIKETVIISGLRYFSNYVSSHPDQVKQEFGQFDADLLSFQLAKISLTLKYHYPEDLVYISAYANVSYNKENIGSYQLVFDLNGEILDDFWSDFCD